MAPVVWSAVLFDGIKVGLWACIDGQPITAFRRFVENRVELWL